MKKFFALVSFVGVCLAITLSTNTLVISADNEEVVAESEVFVYTEYEESSFYAEDIRKEDPTLTFGAEEIDVAPQPGIKHIVFEITMDADGEIISRKQLSEEVVKEAVALQYRVGTKVEVVEAVKEEGTNVVSGPSTEENNQKQPAPTPKPETGNEVPPAHNPVVEPEKPSSVTPTPGNNTDSVSQNNSSNSITPAEDESNNQEVEVNTEDEIDVTSEIGDELAAVVDGNNENTLAEPVHLVEPVKTGSSANYLLLPLFLIVALSGRKFYKRVKSRV